MDNKQNWTVQVVGAPAPPVQQQPLYAVPRARAVPVQLPQQPFRGRAVRLQLAVAAPECLCATLRSLLPYP